MAANVLSDENEINSSKITTLIGPKLSSMWCKERKKKIELEVQLF